MLFWTGRQRWHKGSKPLVRIGDVLEWAMMGFWFGTVAVFGWRRAFHMPLLPLTIGSFAAGCLVTPSLKWICKASEKES